MGDEESGSIRMQRKLLKEFIAERFQDYELLEFEDDGYSGASFNRPGVTQLLEMVRNTEIDCIIVKDFSRFSRDYIELGAYIEQIFPFMGVRFISVNDGYDSADKRRAAGELDISFKSLLYDLYSKDLSVKVKSALKVRKERGQYISSNSPFGYTKSCEDRHMLLVEEAEAEVVRRIFTLALQGRSSSEIAKLFNREGVRTPMQFRAEKGETGRIPKNGVFIWQSSTVCQILRNQAYVGDLVYGKSKKETVGGKNLLKPRNEWKIYENHHEPIIDRRIFQMLQERQGVVGPQGAVMPQTGRARHPFIGKLVCGGCGRNMCFRKMSAPCFICPCKSVISLEQCAEKTDALSLEQYVLSEMQRHVSQMEGGESLRKRCLQNAEKKLKEWKKKRGRLQREEALLVRQKAEAYEACLGKKKSLGGELSEEKSSGGELSEEKDLCGKSAKENVLNGSRTLAQKPSVNREDILKTKLAEIEKAMMTVKVNIAESEEKIADLGRIINGIQEAADIMDPDIMNLRIMDRLGLTKLTEQNASEFIEKIVVYGDRKIEIHWVEWEKVTLFRQLCDTGGN